PKSLHGLNCRQQRTALEPTTAAQPWRREPLLMLRLLGCLPLKDGITGSGGRRPRSLGGGNRGRAWDGGSVAGLWGFENGASGDVVRTTRSFDEARGVSLRWRSTPLRSSACPWDGRSCEMATARSEEQMCVLTTL